MIEIYLISLLLILLIDISWIYLVMQYQYQAVANQVISGEFNFNITSAILCYMLLAIPFSTFLKKQDTVNATICGIVIYGVFALTNYSIFPNWPLELALLDTIWGGILFATVSFLMKKWISFRNNNNIL